MAAFGVEQAVREQGDRRGGGAEGSQRGDPDGRGQESEGDTNQTQWGRRKHRFYEGETEPWAGNA
jgi:hypothetical protein